MRKRDMVRRDEKISRDHWNWPDGIIRLARPAGAHRAPLCQGGPQGSEKSIIGDQKFTIQTSLGPRELYL